MSILDRLRRANRRSRMSCAEVAEVLQAYLDGELGADTVPLVEDHLESCRRCGLDASVYADVKHALANRVAPRPESVERLRAFGKRIAHGDGRAAWDAVEDPLA